MAWKPKDRAKAIKKSSAKNWKAASISKDSMEKSRKHLAGRAAAWASEYIEASVLVSPPDLSPFCFPRLISGVLFEVRPSGQLAVFDFTQLLLQCPGWLQRCQEMCEYDQPSSHVATACYSPPNVTSVQGWPLAWPCWHWPQLLGSVGWVFLSVLAET